MKNNSFMVLAFAFAMLNACTNDISEQDQNEQNNSDLECSFIAKGFLRDSGQSRTSITPQSNGAEFSWTEGDMIGVLPDEGSQVYFTIQNINAENADKATFTGGAWGLKSENNYAAYYPFIKDIMLDRTKVPVDYTGQVHKGTVTVGESTIKHLASHDYMAAMCIKQESGKLNFEFEHLGALVEVKFKVPTPGSVNRFCLSASEPIIPMKGTFDLTASTVAITSTDEDKAYTLTIDVENVVTTSDNEEISIFCLMQPMSGVNTNTLTATAFLKDSSAGLPLKITTEKELESGKYYTLQAESITEQPDAIYLSTAYSDFSYNNPIAKALKDLGGTKLKFISGSSVVSENVVLTDAEGVSAYAVKSGDWLEIHTIAKDFKLSGRCSGMFDGSRYSDFSKLTEIDLSQINTSEATDMQAMFVGCSSLASLDLSSFDTSNVSMMMKMFNGCSSLTSLNLSSFNTSNVKSMNRMFSECISLNSLDLSNFDTSKVQEMVGMFENCKKLESINLKDVNTSNIYNMSYMFAGCTSLKSLDLSSFETSKVQTMENMFYKCSSLNSIDLSNFKTYGVGILKSMFEGCGQLKSLDLSNFQTQGVYDMSYMFANCSNLESLNLSTFKTDAAENMSYMFWQCRSLALLDLSNCSFKNTLTRNAIDCTLIFDGIGLGFGYGVIESVIYVTTNGKSYLESLQEKYGYTTGLRSNAKLVVKSN